MTTFSLEQSRDASAKQIHPLNTFLTEYKEINEGNKYRPVAVGRYGIRKRESIYSKELAKDYSKNKLIHENTLTVGMGSSQIDIGILTDEITYSVSPAYHTYKVRGIDATYLRYCLECRNQDMFVRYVKKGSRQGKTIDFKRWLQYEIPVWNDEVQSKIVSNLDYVSSLIERVSEQVTLLDSLVKSRFVEMFGDPIDDKIWPCVTLAELCTKLGSGATPRGGKSAYKTEGIPLIRSMNVHNGRFVWKDLAYIDDDQAAKLNGVTLMKGDVLLNITGASVARSCILPDELAGGRVNQHVSIVRVDQTKMLPVILNTALISDSYQRFLLNGSRMAGATREAITKEDLKNMTVPLPPLSLQQQFANFAVQVDKLRFEACYAMYLLCAAFTLL